MLEFAGGDGFIPTLFRRDAVLAPARFTPLLCSIPVLSFLPSSSLAQRSSVSPLCPLRRHGSVMEPQSSLPGDAARGRDAATVCQACHRIGSAGVDSGPDITAYGKQQTREVIAQAIATPSADISHGFEGSVVKLKDGLIITGMVVSIGDPLLVKCMGGIVQTVPRSRVQPVSRMDRSLMYDPALLSLDARRISDIVTYLKSL